jgi:hypothetical protein
MAEPVAQAGQTGRLSLNGAGMSAVKRLFYLALPVAVLGLFVALDLSAYAGCPEQHNRNAALAALTLVFAITAGRTIGVWFGLTCCGWNLAGVLLFAAAQVATAAIAVLAVVDPAAWSAMDRLCTALGAVGLTGLLAVLVVALLAGCYATRRAAPSDQ